MATGVGDTDAQTVYDIVRAGRSSKVIKVHPDELIPSFIGRAIDDVRLEDLKDKMRAVGWRPEEPVLAVILPSGTREGAKIYRVYGGSHRTVAAQRLGLKEAYLQLLNLNAHGQDFSFLEKNEALFVREIQVSEPAPEPFGIMAQVGLLRGLFEEYSKSTMKGLPCTPTLMVARTLFCPIRKSELTSRDHFIFEKSENAHKYYRGACRIIEAGVLDDLVQLESRYGSRDSFKKATLRACDRLKPEELATIVLDFIAKLPNGGDEDDGVQHKLPSLRKLKFSRRQEATETEKKKSKRLDPSASKLLDTEAQVSGRDDAGSELEQSSEYTVEPDKREIFKMATKYDQGGAQSCTNKSIKRCDWENRSLCEEIWRCGTYKTAVSHSYTMERGFSYTHLTTTVTMNEKDCSTIMQASLLTDHALRFVAAISLHEITLDKASAFWFYDTIVSATFIQDESSEKHKKLAHVVSVSRAQIWADIKRNNKATRFLIPFYLSPETTGGGMGHWVLAFVDKLDRLGGERKKAGSPVCYVYDSCPATRYKSKDMVHSAVTRLVRKAFGLHKVPVLEMGVVTDQLQQEDVVSCGFFVVLTACRLLQRLNRNITPKERLGQVASVPDLKKKSHFICTLHLEKGVAPNLWALLQLQHKLETEVKDNEDDVMDEVIQEVVEEAEHSETLGIKGVSVAPILRLEDWPMMTESCPGAAAPISSKLTISGPMNLRPRKRTKKEAMPAVRESTTTDNSGAAVEPSVEVEQVPGAPSSPPSSEGGQKL
jgi:Ulp1 protease family, C-terminal catalytic domain